MFETSCPNPKCHVTLTSVGFTGYGTTIFACPKCLGEYEIKVNKEPKR